MRELSEHILDVLYNAVEAGARRVQVSITEDLRADRLQITVTDDGRGLTAAEARKVLDPFYTTRATRHVGLGIPLLAEAARACEGDLSVHSQPGVGTTVTAWFRHSHVDRQPLGDLATTLMTILVGQPELELEYHHECDGRSFHFSTAQAREAAGDLSFSHPAVARWLREYLAEGERSIQTEGAIGDE
jgi:hypothetical protein